MNLAKYLTIRPSEELEPGGLAIVFVERIDDEWLYTEIESMPFQKHEIEEYLRDRLIEYYEMSPDEFADYMKYRSENEEHYNLIERCNSRYVYNRIDRMLYKERR